MTRESVIFQYKMPITSIIITEENKSIRNDKTIINFIARVHKSNTNGNSTELTNAEMKIQKCRNTQDDWRRPKGDDQMLIGDRIDL